jgi:hypothetical protein
LVSEGLSIGEWVGSSLTGYEAYPNVVGIVVGLITCFAITYFLAEKIDSNATDKVRVASSPSLLD